MSKRNGTHIRSDSTQSHPLSYRKPPKETHRIENILTSLAIFFVVASGLTSFFGRESTLRHRMLNSLSAPSLTPTQRLDRTWTRDKCRDEFPLLHRQLNDSNVYWEGRGGITKQMIDRNEQQSNKRWGHTRLIIRDGKVYIRTFKEGKETRNSALVHLISMAVNSWPLSDEVVPPIDLILSPGDKDTGFGEGGWAVAKPSDGREPGTWLLPDFGFVAWPEAGAGSYDDFVGDAFKVEDKYSWSKKGSKLFWRGFPNNYAFRHDLMDRVSTSIDSSREAWSDVHQTTFDDKTMRSGEERFPLVTLSNHCKHRFLVHVEGYSYSGRSKYLFSCRSVTIVHPLEWTQHFHPALNGNPQSPNQNYIQLEGLGFEGLQDAAIELRKADAGVWSSRVNRYIGTKSPEKVADNAMRTLRDRYLSPAATMCYTRAALRHYSQALDSTSFGPQGVELIRNDELKPSVSKGRPLGGLKGDLEVGVWRLLGGPDWPPVK